ncbi:hypothetical protein B0T16DRAFT_491318 [Cercophora newfieldiana]|uniref:Uncharacterized protein n=1 Tax=Cercophora newfieldiana TaxID=92897 RepID=A0AA39Y9P9_9PEZI|nr:hypothetical protein B0T16DRAFT_491318 [Cercophora newfieldiana]
MPFSLSRFTNLANMSPSNPPSTGTKVLITGIDPIRAGSPDAPSTTNNDDSFDFIEAPRSPSPSLCSGSDSDSNLSQDSEDDNLFASARNTNANTATTTPSTTPLKNRVTSLLQRRRHRNCQGKHKHAANMATCPWRKTATSAHQGKKVEGNGKSRSIVGMKAGDQYLEDEEYGLAPDEDEWDELVEMESSEEEEEGYYGGSNR